MALTDRASQFIKFKLKPGNAAEVSELPTLRNGVLLTETSELLGDKAFDSNAVRSLLASLGIIATIPPKSNRREAIHYDAESYQARHLVENAFADVKQFRGIATRYCKLATMYAGLFGLAAWFVGTKTARRGPSPHRRQSEPDRPLDCQLQLAIDIGP